MALRYFGDLGMRLKRHFWPSRNEAKMEHREWRMEDRGHSGAKREILGNWIGIELRHVAARGMISR
jgi:hypothetical protein